MPLITNTRSIVLFPILIPTLNCIFSPRHKRLFRRRSLQCFEIKGMTIKALEISVALFYSKHTIDKVCASYEEDETAYKPS